MRDQKMERLVLFPFTVGCASESSVAVAIQGRRRSKPDDHHTNPSPIRTKKEVEEDHDRDDESLSDESSKSSFRSSLSLPKPNIGIHRIFKGFKNLSQYFAYKEEIEEAAMEIGGPTNVKHVTHIGWDGSTMTNDDAIKGWENLISPELHVPWRQSFDHLSMANQPDHARLLDATAS